MKFRRFTVSKFVSFSVLFLMLALLLFAFTSTASAQVYRGPNQVVYGRYQMDFGSTIEEINVSAGGYRDGSVSGTFSVVDRSSDGSTIQYSESGNITCLVIEGDTAYIGGEVTEGTFAGNDATLTVRDLGKNDQSTDFSFGRPSGTAEQYCQEPLGSPVNYVPSLGPIASGRLYVIKFD